MVQIRTSVESARGCGYRKPGGLYLVSGKLSAPCGKLPIPLHVCPTCSGGIKPTRSWQWIMPRVLFGGVECRHMDLHNCASCPVSNFRMPDRGGLVWVGGSFYPTPEDFLREARTMGVSRRIPAIPKGFEPGKTVVYLAHRECIEVPVDTTPMYDGHINPVNTGKPKMRPAVFSAFIPSAIEYVVKGDETEDELERIEKRGLSLVKVERQQPELFPEAGEKADG